MTGPRDARGTSLLALFTVCALVLLASAVPVAAVDTDDRTLADSSTTTESVTVRGVVEINQDPARSGTGITFSLLGSGVFCGSTTTVEGGRFSIVLTPACLNTPGTAGTAADAEDAAEGGAADDAAAGAETGAETEAETSTDAQAEDAAEAGAEDAATATLVVTLQRLPQKRSPDELSVRLAADAESEQQLRTVGFQLTTEELRTLYPEEEAPPTDDAAGQALVQQVTSVYEELSGMSIGLLIAAVVVLLAMVIGMSYVTNRRYAFAQGVWDRIDKMKPDENIEPLLKALQTEGESYQKRLGVFRWMVEGMVMSFVVVTILALGAAGKVTPEGIVSILAALVGYAAGRMSSSNN